MISFTFLSLPFFFCFYSENIFMNQLYFVTLHLKVLMYNKNNNMKQLFFILALLLATGGSVMAKSVKKQHVILIGLDGWGAYSVPKAHDIPNIKNMMEHGAYTLKKRSVLESSSAINWASMFNGACTEQHGYTEWGSRTPEIPSAIVNSRGIFPTIYSILYEQHPEAETACMMEWDGIKYLVDSLAISRVEVVSDYLNNLDKLTELAVDYIKEKRPNFAAFCYDGIDHAGHESGHDTPAYYDAIARADRYVGRIVQATKDAGIFENTIFIITSDHGGKEKGHGGKTLLEMETPFIIYGKGIKEGYRITDVMMQFDVAATIAEIFHLKRPQAWRGQPITSVFKGRR